MEILKTRRDSAPPKVATLAVGETVRSAMEYYIDRTCTSSRKLVRIAALRRPPDGAVDQSTVISTSDSEAEVRLWYKTSQTQVGLYFVTDARVLYLNADCMNMFYFTPSKYDLFQNGFEIDLSGVHVSLERVTDAQYMFACARIGTILVRRGVFLPAGAVSTGMFNGCIRLIGGAGTHYDSSHTDGTYARIDNPPDSPGYFTEAT